MRLHDLRHAVGYWDTKQAQTTLRYAHLGIDPALAAAEDVGSVVSIALSRGLQA